MIAVILETMLNAFAFLGLGFGLPIVLAVAGAWIKARRAELRRLRKRVAELEHDQALILSAA